MDGESPYAASCVLSASPLPGFRAAVLCAGSVVMVVVRSVIRPGTAAGGDTGGDQAGSCPVVELSVGGTGDLSHRRSGVSHYPGFVTNDRKIEQSTLHSRSGANSRHTDS